MVEPVGMEDVGTVIDVGGVGYVAARMLLSSSTIVSNCIIIAGRTQDAPSDVSIIVAAPVVNIAICTYLRSA